jgi:hypothetical protein
MHGYFAVNVSPVAVLSCAHLRLNLFGKENNYGT